MSPRAKRAKHAKTFMACTLRGHVAPDWSQFFRRNCSISAPSAKAWHACLPNRQIFLFLNRLIVPKCSRPACHFFQSPLLSTENSAGPAAVTEQLDEMIYWWRSLWPWLLANFTQEITEIDEPF
jgi:hypothetical protein